MPQKDINSSRASSNSCHSTPPPYLTTKGNQVFGTWTFEGHTQIIPLCANMLPIQHGTYSLLPAIGSEFSVLLSKPTSCKIWTLWHVKRSTFKKTVLKDQNLYKMVSHADGMHSW